MTVAEALEKERIKWHINLSIRLRDIESLCAVACQTCAARGPWRGDFPQCWECQTDTELALEGEDANPPRMPVSTPQAPAGCSCRSCLAWVEFFPQAHHLWLRFRAGRIYGFGKVWWKSIDRLGRETWMDDWIERLNADWTEDIPK